MIEANIDQHTNHSIAQQTSFSWAPDCTLSYLVIRLITPTSCLLQLNFSHLVSKLQKTARDVQIIQASWARCIALTKMYLLPQILYLFRTLPIPFLHSHLNKLQAMLISFIWNGKRPRIKCSTLCSPTSARGMGAPDISAYFKATILHQTLVENRSTTYLAANRSNSFSDLPQTAS